VRYVEHDGETKMHIGLFLRMCRIKLYLGDLGMDGRIILKYEGKSENKVPYFIATK
jgi:hypothetical protein